MLRLAVVAFFVAAFVCAQQDRATFTGNVTDPSGAPLSGVKIELANTATNSSYESLTNEAGRYSVPNLPVGAYKLTFHAPRFKTYVRESVTLSVTQVVRVNKRFSAGLNLLSNYTFSKSIDNVRSAFGDTWGANSGRPANYYNLALDKSISDADRTHTFKVAAQYDLPFGRGRRFGSTARRAVDSAFSGWTIQYIGNYNSGWPLGIGGSGTPNSNFATNSGFAINPNGRPLIAGWNSDRIDMSRINQPSAANKFINTSVFVDPIAIGRYQRGNTSYKLSQLRGPWELSDDFSLQKNFRPLESLRIQLRAEFLNAFNRTLWGNIEVNASSPLFGQVTGASDWFSPRKIQFGVRADW